MHPSENTTKRSWSGVPSSRSMVCSSITFLKNSTKRAQPNMVVQSEA